MREAERGWKKLRGGVGRWAEVVWIVWKWRVKRWMLFVATTAMFVEAKNAFGLTYKDDRLKYIFVICLWSFLC